MGVALSAGEEASSSYLKDLERKISALAEHRFSGHERMFPSISDDEDEDAVQHFGGAGGVGISQPRQQQPPNNNNNAVGRRTNNTLGRNDVVNRNRPNRRRGMNRAGLDQIGDDSD